MNTSKFMTVLSIFLLAVLILSAACKKTPVSGGNINGGGNSSPQQPADAKAREIQASALQWLTALGFDASKFSVVSTELTPREAPAWTVQFKNDQNVIAVFTVMEESRQVVEMKLDLSTANSIPQTIEGGEGMPERVVQALGLVSEGYVKSKMSASCCEVKFVKVAKSANWDILVGAVSIIPDPVEGRLSSVMIQERELPATPVVNITRDEAMRLAGESMRGATQAGPIDAQLVLMPGGRPGESASVYWEVLFATGQNAYIKSDDGAFRSGFQKYAPDLLANYTPGFF
jgi:hypothetical protein